MNLPSLETVLKWTWESVIKNAVTTAINAAWTVIGGVLLALTGLSLASDIKHPLDAPETVAGQVKAIVLGMDTLVKAADFYLKSNGQ